MLGSNILDSLLVQNSKITLKEFHVERTFEAYRFLRLAVSKNQIQKIYDDLETNHQNAALRLVFSKNLPVQCSAEIKPLDSLPTPIKLSLMISALESTEYKWENRTAWVKIDSQKPKGTDDVLVLTPQGFLRETTRFNIFCYDEAQNTFYTPPLDTGCINGVYRRYALKNGIDKSSVIEKPLLYTDLKDYKIFVANSARGLLPAIITEGLK
jgi:branched-subunit amino acid aminotransferase/4-amino-4-deoxychorismate lyase